MTVPVRLGVGGGQHDRGGDVLGGRDPTRGQGLRGLAEVGPPPDLVADIVFGVIWYRVLAGHRPLDEGLPAELTATLAGGPFPA
jgi:hypothetical protein